MRRAAIATFLLAVLAGAQAMAGVPPLLPLRAFAAIPALDDPELSPDGRTFASQFRKGGESFLVLHDILGARPGEPATRSMQMPPKTTINWTGWLNDQYLLVSIRQFTREFGPEDVPYDRLYMVHRLTREVTPIGPRGGGLSGDDVIFWARDGSYVILNFQRDVFSPPAALRVDLPSNRVSYAERARRDIWRWFANSRGEVIAGAGVTRDERLQVIYRASPREEFQTLGKLAIWTEADGIEPVYLAQIDADTQTGYVISRRGGDRWGLHEYDFRAGTYGRTLFGSDAVDLDDYHIDRSGKLRWVSYIDDRLHMQWFSADDRRFYESLERAVPARMAWVVSSSSDDRRRIVRAGSPTDPGTFYFYSDDTGTMKRLGGVNDALAGQPLAAMEYVTYKARDGVEIHAYLTRPVGRAAQRLPLVVMPHGGPFHRDQWQYDFLVQYLANRGYAVLQPNFRGSTGYGKAFMRAGFSQMGKAMQDDLDDGVAWLAASGEVDPHRVCMVGWSYGGYAAQVAAYRNPEIYRCAASIAGISDLGAMVRYDRDFMYRKNWLRWSSRFKGDADSRALGEVSSIRHVREIRVPLLLVHGEDDDVVPVRQSASLARELKDAGKDYEFVRIADADHGLREEDQRLQLLTALERFLAAHNPTDVLGAK